MHLLLHRRQIVIDDVLTILSIVLNSFVNTTYHHIPPHTTTQGHITPHNTLYLGASILATEPLELLSLSKEKFEKLIGGHDVHFVNRRIGISAEVHSTVANKHGAKSESAATFGIDCARRVFV
jgi:hypothetical protein